MRQLIFVFMLTGLLFTSGCVNASQTDESRPSTEDKNYKSPDMETIPDNFVRAKVTRVVDGDTMKVLIDDKEDTVRLLLVDTPETKAPNKPVQRFGKEASNFAEEVLTNQEVRLEYDGPIRDKYDRLLVYLWIGDQIFNEMLLEEGYARLAYVYDPPYTHFDTFMKAENKAKEKGLRIWSIDNYVQEDGFYIEDPDVDETDDSAYENCDEAREAGVAPIYEGEPGYSPYLDGDRDGIACE